MNRESLHTAIRAHAAGGYTVDRVIDCACTCGNMTFLMGLNRERGVAVRVCLDCDSEFALLDSAEVLEHSRTDIELEPAECTCDATEFTAAVGFALAPNGDVGWVSIGLRCEDCSLAGVYTDWGINAEPSAFLLERV